MDQYSTNSYPSQKFRPINLMVLVGASVSHVTAIIFWTLAFQSGKTGKVSIIAYSMLIYSMLVDLFVFEITFSLLQGAGMLIVFAASFAVALTKF